MAHDTSHGTKIAQVSRLYKRSQANLKALASNGNGAILFVKGNSKVVFQKHSIHWDNHLSPSHV